MANVKFGGYKVTNVTGIGLVGAILGLIVFCVASLFFQAWIIMLLAGAIHGSVWASFPAFGFWAACLVTVALHVVGSFFKRS